MDKARSLSTQSIKQLLMNFKRIRGRSF